MFRSFSSVIAIAFAGIYFALPMQAQAPPPATPVSLNTTAAPEAPRPQDSAGITTLHARSNLVVIDVVVSDSKQNPVHGLKKEDFTLMENGKPQSIKNFEEHAQLPAAATSPITSSSTKARTSGPRTGS